MQDQTFPEAQKNACCAALSRRRVAGRDGVVECRGIVWRSDFKITNGANFNVVASYNTKSGQQAYTIVVNGQYLEVASIAAGGSHTCAVTTSGGAKCWGTGSSGQLGDGLSA